MNTETGEIYRTLQEREAALAHGETVVDVSEDVADAVEIGLKAIAYGLNRAERRALKYPKNESRMNR